MDSNIRSAAFARACMRLTLWLICVAGCSAAQSEDTRPNILLVFADDLRADALGLAGNPAARTPHLDALGARGASFRRAYCLGGPHGAVCIPSRAMLLTGRAYFQLDLQDFTGARTLGEVLGGAGYATFATGKVTPPFVFRRIACSRACPCVRRA
jgi:hypothetical protein